MTFEERKALVKSYLGKTVDIKIDRPIGSTHPKHPNLTYPINYGYIPNVLGGDGEELDVYLLGVDNPVKEYSARIIGIVHRHNDVEDKLVAAPVGLNFTSFEIEEAVHFQEQYYESEIEAFFEKSCGTVLYTTINNVIHYLLIKSEDNYCGFPRGHIEKFETEIETALRETWEETSIKATITNGFRQETTYTMGNGKTKSVVYFLASYAKEQIKKYGALGIEFCNVISIYSVKENMQNNEFLELLAPSVYNPTLERLQSRAKKYENNENAYIFVFKENVYKGIVVFEIKDNNATILDIAVKPEYQGRGVGSKLIDFIFNQFGVHSITAETDDDAIGFYK
ncbi:MAG: GNAT family N-acetyltransferase [Clostridia bacterium]|nr:GNAT family N-acetyltransferase [Clostridia bacterium]